MMRKYSNLNPLESLYISGPVLSGKTWVGSRIALELHLLGARAEEIIYTTLMDMVSDMLDSGASISKYYEIRFLFIDNVNTEKNAYAPSLLARVVRHRLDNDKHVAIISSLDGSTFANLYGEEMQKRIEQFLQIELRCDEEALARIREARFAKLAEDVSDVE